MMKFPETLRLKKNFTDFLPPHNAGDTFGAFGVKYGHVNLFIIASDASDPSAKDWEHVSVSTQHRTPSWEEMNFVKNLFWEEEDCVVQFHPPKSEYINCAKNCLHLWRYVGFELPRPPKILVGPG